MSGVGTVKLLPKRRHFWLATLVAVFNLLIPLWITSRYLDCKCLDVIIVIFKFFQMRFFCVALISLLKKLKNREGNGNLEYFFP